MRDSSPVTPAAREAGRERDGAEGGLTVTVGGERYTRDAANVWHGAPDARPSFSAPVAPWTSDLLDHIAAQAAEIAGLTMERDAVLHSRGVSARNWFTTAEYQAAENERLAAEIVNAHGALKAIDTKAGVAVAAAGDGDLRRVLTSVAAIARAALAPPPDEKIICGICGAEFNPASLDEVVYHEQNPHAPIKATGIMGERVAPPPAAATGEWECGRCSFEGIPTDCSYCPRCHTPQATAPTGEGA